MRPVLGIAAAFTLGVALALAWAAAQRRPTHEVAASPPPAARVEVLTRRVSRPETRPEAARIEGGNPLADVDRMLGEERNRTRREVRDVSTWDDFYAVTRSLDIQDFQLEDLILRRIAGEVGLPRETIEKLQVLLNEEQVEVTKVALARHGTALLSLFSLKGDAAKPIWDDLIETRKAVRGTFDVRYEALLAPEQLKAVNRHLRNDYARLFKKSSVNEPDQILVIGAGQLPSGP